ncbi:hypothetical protein KSS87_000970, partial [Heliosperma pusillum]
MARKTIAKKTPLKKQTRTTHAKVVEEELVEDDAIEDVAARNEEKCKVVLGNWKGVVIEESESEVSLKKGKGKRAMARENEAARSILSIFMDPSFLDDFHALGKKFDELLKINLVEPPSFDLGLDDLRFQGEEAEVEAVDDPIHANENTAVERFRGGTTEQPRNEVIRPKR